MDWTIYEIDKNRCLIIKQKIRRWLREFSAAFRPNRHITNLGINKEKLKFLVQRPTKVIKQRRKTKFQLFCFKLSLPNNGLEFRPRLWLVLQRDQRGNYLLQLVFEKYHKNFNIGRKEGWESNARSTDWKAHQARPHIQEPQPIRGFTG